MTKKIGNLLFYLMTLGVYCASTNTALAYNGGVYYAGSSGGGVYDDSARVERPARSSGYSSSAIQRQAMQAARRAEREAASEARRQEMAKKAAERAQKYNGKASDAYKESMQKWQDYKTTKQRNAYFSRQTPINEQKLLQMMSDEQKRGYNEEKLSKWYSMTPEERFLFVQNKQDALNRQVLDLQDQRRLETNFQ
jgi:hypothetical protein